MDLIPPDIIALITDQLDVVSFLNFCETGFFRVRKEFFKNQYAAKKLLYLQIKQCAQLEQELADINKQRLDNRTHGATQRMQIQHLGADEYVHYLRNKMTNGCKLNNIEETFLAMYKQDDVGHVDAELEEGKIIRARTDQMILTLLDFLKQENLRQFSTTSKNLTDFLARFATHTDE